MSGILRTAPRHPARIYTRGRYYNQHIRCVKCREWRDIAGGSRKGGRFTCKQCKEQACA
jgi:hypothetical protein